MSPVGLTPSGQWRTAEDGAPTVCAQARGKERAPARVSKKAARVWSRQKEQAAEDEAQVERRVFYCSLQAASQVWLALLAHLMNPLPIIVVYPPPLMVVCPLPGQLATELAEESLPVDLLVVDTTGVHPKAQRPLQLARTTTTGTPYPHSGVPPPHSGMPPP